MTIQQFIKAARKLSPIVLEHAIIFHEAFVCGGLVRRGKNNETMRKLRRLGYFAFDRKSTSGTWDPTWRVTDAGRALIPLQHHSEVK